MPYKSNRQLSEERKYLIRFRGSAIIPRLNQMAPCRLELTMDTIGSILESLYRRPLRMEVMYVDKFGKEWELKYNNYRKILPTEEEKIVLKAIKTPDPITTETSEFVEIPTVVEQPVITEIPIVIEKPMIQETTVSDDIPEIDTIEVTNDDLTLDEDIAEEFEETEQDTIAEAAETHIDQSQQRQQQQYHSKNYKKHHKK